MAKKIRREISLTAGQAGEVLSPITEVVLGMSSTDAQYWIGNKKKLSKEIRKILVRSNDNEYFDLLLDWQNFYKKLFGTDYNFSNIRIPEKSEGNWRLLIIADITLETLYAKCKELFPCWRWTNDDFDKIVAENERTAKDGSYAIWAKDEVEADENLKNKSANDIKAIKLNTETFAERFVHELKFFQETGKHLDIKNITLCAGSRYSDGNVPSVRWHGSFSEMSVDWYDPGVAHGHLGSREVVS